MLSMCDEYHTASYRATSVVVSLHYSTTQTDTPVQEGSREEAQTLPLLLVLVLGRQPNLPLKRNTKHY